MSESYRYDAFISYRHLEPDRSAAVWLHKALETYKTPKDLIRQGFPGRIKRVFRDEEELSASSDLSNEISTALKQSEYLIVVCSPRIVESIWCDQEVKLFRDMGRHDKIIALLIEGEPSESFLPSLCEIKKHIIRKDGSTIEEIETVEPLAADIRPRPEHSQKELRYLAKLRILATLLGCKFDDLRQREQKRKQRFMARAAAGLSLLVLVFALLSAWALQQEKRAKVNEAEALKQKNIAVENEAEALKQKLTAQQKEKEARFSSYVSLIQVASQNIKSGNRLEAQRAMINCPAEYRNFEWQLLANSFRKDKYKSPLITPPVTELQFFGDGILTAEKGGRIFLHSHSSVNGILNSTYSSPALLKGKIFRVNSKYGVTINEGLLELYSHERGTKIKTHMPKAHLKNIFFSPDSFYIFAIYKNGDSSLLKINGTEISTVFTVENKNFHSVHFDVNNSRLTAVGTSVEVYSLSGELIFKEDLPALVSYASALDPAGILYISSVNGTVVNYDINKKKLLFNEKITRNIFHWMFLNKESNRLLGITRQGKLFIYSLPEMKELLIFDTGFKKIERAALSDSILSLALYTKNKLKVISAAPLQDSTTRQELISSLDFTELAEKEFIEACRNRNSSVIRKYVKLKAVTPNIKDDSGLTALCCAAAVQNNSEVITTLIELGSDVNDTTTGKNWTALNIAVLQKDNHENIKTLLKYGAKAIESPLLAAAQTINNEKTVELLMQAGYKVNDTDREGNTALLAAAGVPGNHKTVSILLKAGADFNIRSLNNASVLHEAAKKKNNLKTVKLLVEAGADTQSLLNGATPLTLSCIANDTETAIYLTDKTPSYKNPLKPMLWTPLMIAARNGNTELVKHFYDKGIPLDAKSSSNMTALMLACGAGRSNETVKLLLKNGADINLKSNEGLDALLYNVKAATSNEIIIELLKKGASLKNTDKNGDNAFALLVQKPEFRPAIEYMLTLKPGVNSVCKSGLTPIMHASRAPGSKWIIKELINRGAEADKADQFGNTTLMSAARLANNEDVVEVLLKEGVKTNIYNNSEGVSALIYASQHSNTGSLKLLLKYGADPSQKSPSGISPLIMACLRQNFNGVKILAEAGADLNYESPKEKMTALQMAIYKKHPAIVKYLVEKGALIRLADIDFCKDQKLKIWLSEKKNLQ